jgi:hypothetical protein
MKLDLRFTARPLEDVWCDTVIGFVFQDSIGNGNGVPGLDAKTSGALSKLGEKGFWTGVEGETLLLPSQDMIKADKILLQGLGVQSDYSINFLAEKIEALCSTLERMAVNDISIRIPVKGGEESEYPSYVEAACKHLVDFFLPRHQEEAGFLLKLIVSLDDMFLADLEPTIRQLKEHFESRLDYTIVFDRSALSDQ